MIRKFIDFLTKPEPRPVLGRWAVKSCSELLTSINSVYQNRDHCGDVICHQPKKAEEYIKTDKKLKT